MYRGNCPEVHSAIPDVLRIPVDRPGMGVDRVGKQPCTFTARNQVDSATGANRTGHSTQKEKGEMTAWQTDLMLERQSESMWERLNRPDPAEEQMIQAASRVNCGLACIDDGIDWVSEAVKKLEGTPMADRLQSILNDLETLSTGLADLNRRYERGCRE